MSGGNKILTCYGHRRIKEKAKDGRVEAQKELAHAYLEGNGVPKNRAHYLTWLTKAAERGDVDSQKELAKFYNDKRSNYSKPKEALFWMRKAQEQGAEFSDEERAEIEAGDSSVCCEKNTCSRTVLSRVFRILGTLIDTIGVRALLLSTVLLLCIIFIDWSWIERLRYGLKELLPGLTILTYLGLFALLTTVFSIMFKYLDKKKTRNTEIIFSNLIGSSQNSPLKTEKLPVVKMEDSLDVRRDIQSIFYVLKMKNIKNHGLKADFGKILIILWNMNPLV